MTSEKLRQLRNHLYSRYFLKEEYFDHVNLPNRWDEYAYNIDAGLFAKKMLEIGLENGGTILEDEVTNLVSNEEVSIRRITYDRYKRTVGELFINGINIQELIVQKGYGKIYKRKISRHNLF